ncbi:hypothetical protein PAXRUDRAFT_15700 [Paxillus rubicundulus Ve08.2h10]|uniref:Transmembrane protein n=1 Tax=Paxillus rubicundulus Ve08.2h10 TaxID=930991 RepID=A0A0D0D9T6_9AGAM|nr:hypothetical protein PAXRUDRAFT_15700 [Paxillus rubicundulus Ve08.2h10]
MSTSKPRSFITLLLLLAMFVQGLPIYDHYLSDRGQVVAFWPWKSTPSEKFGLRPVQDAIQLLIDDRYKNSTRMMGVHNSPGATVLTPYQQKPTVPAAPILHPSASRIPHASMPVQTEHVSHSKTPIIVGAVLGVLLAVFAFVASARCIVRRCRSESPINLGTPQPAEKFVDHFQDPPKSKSIFEFKFKPSASNENARPNRLSNESWVTHEISPHSTFKRSTPPPPLPQILDFRSYAFPGERRLVPVTTPVCTPSDVTVFGSRLELAAEKEKEEHWDETNGHGQGEQPHFIRPGDVYVPLVRVPSPAYVSPFSPSLPMSASPPFRHSPTFSPTPSTETLIHTSPTSANADTIADLRPSGNRLSRLLASSFRDTRETSFRTYSFFSHTSTISTQRNGNIHGATSTIAPGINTPKPAMANTRHPVCATAAHPTGAVRPHIRQSGSTTNSLYARAPGSVSVPSSLRAGGTRSRTSFYGADGTSSERFSLALGNSVSSGLAFGFGFGTSATGRGYTPLCESEEREGMRNMGQMTERGWEITKDRDRDTMTTITTQDTTSTSHYLSRAAVYALLYGQSHIQAPSVATSTTVSPSPSIATYVPPSSSTAASLIATATPSASMEAATPLGLKVRLSDASEHELFRGREKERERRRERAQEQLAKEKEKGNSTQGKKENLQGRERRWKPPGSPSSPSSISRIPRSISVSPSRSPSPPIPYPSTSLSQPKSVYTSMSSRLPHANARPWTQTQTRAHAQTSPKPSIYHSPTSPRADSTGGLLFRERAATLSRVTVVHRNAGTGREHHHHGRPQRDALPYAPIVASPPPSPSLSSSCVAARDIMHDLRPSSPTRKNSRKGRGRGRGIDRPPSTHSRTKSAPGAWVPLTRSQQHSQSQRQAYFRSHVHLHARRRDVSGCPPSHGGEQGTEGDEDYEYEASFSDASDEGRKTRYGLRDSETMS